MKKYKNVENMVVIMNLKSIFLKKRILVESIVISIGMSIIWPLINFILYYIAANLRIGLLEDLLIWGFFAEFLMLDAFYYIPLPVMTWLIFRFVLIILFGILNGLFYKKFLNKIKHRITYFVISFIVFYHIFIYVFGLLGLLDV